MCVTLKASFVVHGRFCRVKMRDSQSIEFLTEIVRFHKFVIIEAYSLGRVSNCNNGFVSKVKCSSQSKNKIVIKNNL
jgi:hypothetical protein